MEIKQGRIALLDEIRGFCVLCMIFYHSFIFMYEQFDISFGYDAYTFFGPVQPFFSCAFLFICGICCNFSHSNLKRGLKLLVLALALSFITIIVLPKLGFVDTSISFGVLHFLSISILIYALLDKPLISKVPGFVGIIVCLFLFYIFRFWLSDGEINITNDLSIAYPNEWRNIPWLFPIGIRGPGYFSADYFPLIPYIFVFFLGSSLGKYMVKGYVPSFAYPIHVKPLYWLGTNALLVYIVHLPIVFIILSFYQWVIGLFA